MIARSRTALLLTAALFFSASLLLAQQPASEHEQCTRQGAKSDDPHAHHEAMMSRGEKGMGFSQTTTTHHFLLRPDGGIIAVSANDPKDKTTRDQIRMHLAHIAHSFAEGDFDIPMFVHDQTPPGVPDMKRLAKDIQYRSRDTDQGGEVVITSTSGEAVHAIHDFLIFQIREHKTGDPIARP